MWFERLDAAFQVLADDEPMPEEVRRWLLHGLSEYVENNTPLEHALGLYPYTRNRYIRRKRDEALRSAYSLIGDINLFARKVKLFSQSKWKAWDTVPDNAAEIDRRLFRAFSCGLSVPTSAKHLRRIVDMDS